MFFFDLFFSPQLILQKFNDHSQRKLSFSEVPGRVTTFSSVCLGGGGGGWWVELLTPYTNPYNLLFSRGGGPDPISLCLEVCMFF